MRYLALALDYDGTAASDGKLSDAASSAIERLRTSGRRVVLVTGRRIGDLLRVLPRSTLFDLIVAENGAVIYDPQSREQIPLAAPLCARFAERLRERGVAPLEEGAVVVATHDPHGGVMLVVAPVSSSGVQAAIRSRSWSRSSRLNRQSKGWAPWL